MSFDFPSIFNDVIGPVMRGPSSSHAAASVRIGRMARDLMDGWIEDVLVAFEPEGSLATTHAGQGSDMGLFAGLLGWEVHEENIENSGKALKDAGIRVSIDIVSYDAGHPNAYRLTLKNRSECHEMLALSTGGGMIEVTRLDGVVLSIAGDYFETLVYVDSHERDVTNFLKKNAPFDHVNLCRGTGRVIVEVKGQRFLDPDLLRRLETMEGVTSVKKISPVLPILSRKDLKVPFTTCREMLAYNEGGNLELWELALRYESARGNISGDTVYREMKRLAQIMEASIAAGLEGTVFEDRILGCQSAFFNHEMEKGRLLECGALNRIILYVTAMMEMKSSMGVIVAAPTAGACGGLPGACIGMAHAMGASIEDVTKGMLAAGMIGLFIKVGSTFAAEVGGCQAECGAASGMAAAALVSLAGGTVTQAVDASSMALQNILGMICDPVASRVEVPCLGKNVLAASNALCCANMALAGFDPVIPLDEVIEAMDKVGRRIPREFRCTALGGLSVTKTAKKMEQNLKHKPDRGGDEGFGR
jgi:L-serine dehydratase